MCRLFHMLMLFYNWRPCWDRHGIYGKFGFPAMGTVGSGWSTAWARIYLSGLLDGYLLWYDRRYRTRLLNTPIQPDLQRIRMAGSFLQDRPINRLSLRQPPRLMVVQRRLQSILDRSG